MYLISIGEIFLKGKNRITFERKLIRNIRLELNLLPNEIQKFRNKYIILKDENINNLQKVFGVNSYSEVIKCDLNEIKETALKLIKNEKTFRISAKSMPSLKRNSIEINNEIGDYILKNKNIKVNLENPEINIRIEEVGNKAYIYTKIIKGPGGLPVGSAGFVFIKVKNEINSAVASYLMMKRGCKIILSKELPILNKFTHSFKLKTREEREHDFVVSDELFEELNYEKDEKFILRPLIGYSEKEIKEIYEKIKNI